MKKHILALALTVPMMLSAQDGIKPEVHLAADARVDWTEIREDSEVDHAASGFAGRYLNVMLDGKLNDHFKFSLRHRLNKSITNGRFFDATDWVYVTYSPNQTFDISAGKQVVCIGGYEYDRAPINIYWASEFWNNIGCYQFGISGTVHFEERDALTFQVCESPFSSPGLRDIYAYNLQWNGQHGPWQTIWTANLMEYQRGEFISYIALGNKVTLGDFDAEIDFMNRAERRQHRFFFSDCSVMATLAYKVKPWVNPFVKYTYDVNKSNYADYCVLPGTEMNTIGAGLEAWPLNAGRNEVRLHGFVGYAWGNNGNPSGAWHDKQLFVNFGIKWRFQILN